MVSYYFICVNIKEFKDNTDNLIETYQQKTSGYLYKTFKTQNEAYTQLGITLSNLEYN
jgi:hypothetical protein